MYGIENLSVFIGTGILLNLYPGPDTLYIIGRSMGQGRAAGVAAALGIGSGAIVHTLLGAFGLSALLAASTHAFTVLKIAGGLYLLYQGVMLLKSQAPGDVATDVLHGDFDLWRIYRQGAVTNILNPKVAMFFLAFLPQFITASSSAKPLSFMLLGVIFVTTGTIWCLMLAFFASAFGQRLKRFGNMSGRLRQLNGLLFIALGLKLATARLGN